MIMEYLRGVPTKDRQQLRDVINKALHYDNVGIYFVNYCYTHRVVDRNGLRNYLEQQLRRQGLQVNTLTKNKLKELLKFAVENKWLAPTKQSESFLSDTDVLNRFKHILLFYLKEDVQESLQAYLKGNQASFDPKTAVKKPKVVSIAESKDLTPVDIAGAAKTEGDLPPLFQSSVIDRLKDVIDPQNPKQIALFDDSFMNYVKQLEAMQNEDDFNFTSDEVTKSPAPVKSDQIKTLTQTVNEFKKHFSEIDLVLMDVKERTYNLGTELLPRWLVELRYLVAVVNYQLRFKLHQDAYFVIDLAKLPVNKMFTDTDEVLFWKKVVGLKVVDPATNKLDHDGPLVDQYLPNHSESAEYDPFLEAPFDDGAKQLATESPLKAITDHDQSMDLDHFDAAAMLDRINDNFREVTHQIQQMLNDHEMAQRSLAKDDRMVLIEAMDQQLDQKLHLHCVWNAAHLIEAEFPGAMDHLNQLLTITQTGNGLFDALAQTSSHHQKELSKRAFLEQHFQVDETADHYYDMTLHGLTNTAVAFDLHHLSYDQLNAIVTMLYMMYLNPGKQI